MDKFKEIRPIALGVAIREEKLLVEEGMDFVKNQTFYRCLGGGINFLEKAEEALKREFREEINVDIKIQKYLGLAENIFTFKGKDAHELILFYQIEIPEEFYKEEYTIIETEYERKEFKAKWIPIKDFKDKKYILYPNEIFNYL